MSEAFDIGPLSWVKDEIDESLRQVVKTYTEVSEAPDQYDALRFALTHLYQVNGALDMVGLDGCKRFCSEIESITAKIDKGHMASTKSIMQDLIVSVQTLSKYLQDLLNGMPDTPLRLFDTLSHLMQLQDETLEETDLFFPETLDVRLPSDLPKKSLEKRLIPAFVGDQRTTFQKGLLYWLIKKDSNGLSSMQTSVANVLKVQDKKAHQSLWWAANAFVDALKQAEIASLAGAKKLCRQIDQQLRNMSFGEKRTPSNLLRDMLYYVAISQPKTDAIKQVKKAFALDAALPSDDYAKKEVVLVSDAERSTMQLVAAEIPQIKHLWLSVTESSVESTFGLDPLVAEAQDTEQDAPIEELQSVTLKLQLLLEHLNNDAVDASQTNHQDMVALLASTKQVTQKLLSEIDYLNEAAALEVAGALNHLEDMASRYETLDVEHHQTIVDQVGRLDALAAAQTVAAPTAIDAELLDDTVIGAVAEQVVDSLRDVEKRIDGFFRNPSMTQGLVSAVRPLSQVVAAFDMLEMPTPKTIAKLCMLYVEQFKENAPAYQIPHPNTDLFNVFAEGLSLLGLYAKDLPEIRPQSKYALTECLQRLEHGLDDLMLPSAEEEDIPTLTAVAAPAAEPIIALEAVEPELVKPPVDDKAPSADRRDTAQLSLVPDALPVDAGQQGYIEIPRFADEDVTDKAIDRDLEEIFIAEAEALLAQNEINLQVLRENETNQLSVTEIRRAFHTLKGSGRTVGLEMLGDVAHAIEKMLNVLIEHKVPPTPEVLAFLNEVNPDYMRWMQQLKVNHAVTFNGGRRQRKAAELAYELEQELNKAKPKAGHEEVLIGGSRKIGRAFFYLFLGEAQTHLKTLSTAKKGFKVGSTSLPSAQVRRAAHTLSSNALTAGFDAIGDLARALENWLDEFYPPWTQKHLALFGRVITAINDGLEKAKNLKHPKSTRSLIIELSKSTAAMQVMAIKLADAAQGMPERIKAETELSEAEIMGTGLSDDELTVNQLPPSRLQDATIEITLDDSAPAKRAEKDISTLEIIAPAADEAAAAAKPSAPAAPLADAANATPAPKVPKLAPSAPVRKKPRIKIERHSVSAPPSQAKAAPNQPAAAPVKAPTKPKISVVKHTDNVQPAQQPVKATAAVDVSPKQQALFTKPETQQDKALVAIFLEEAGELVPQVGKNLRLWKNAPDSKQYIDALQRDLHTLKGSARTAGQTEVGDRVHMLEDRLITALQNKVTLDDFDGMFVDFDRISFMLDSLASSLSEAAEVESDGEYTVEILDDIEHIQDAQLAAEIGVAEPANEEASTSELSAPFLRVRASMLDRLINDAGEVSILRSRMDREVQGLKQSSSDLTLSVSRLRTYLDELELEADSQLQARKTELQETNTTFDPLELDRFTRLQELTRLMAESLNDVSTVQQGLVSHIDETDAALIQQNRMNREMQKNLMTVRMMPFSSISERLHRIVRQISRELNKRVELEIEGESIELDRSVLDKMGGPLEHLLRNAVAHGIEAAQVREQAGKPASGHVHLKVILANDEITLTVSDDGQGIDLDKVKSIAVKRGLLTEKQPMTDEALIAVIFESGFTTEGAVSKVAGRGVGLDAVKSDIAALNGRIDLSNRPGKGVSFNIYLPVSLSVTQVVMVKVNGQQFAIPSVMVTQVQTLKQKALLAAYEAQSVSWDGQDYPLHFLARLVGDAHYKAKTQAYSPVVMLRSGQFHTAVHVDEVVGNQEIVMKSLGTQLSRVPGVIGATVMGDGGIVYMINPVQLAHREVLTAGVVKVTSFAPVEAAKRVALVVDDSLTMRKALSRILEKEGFDVVTANDGMDATQKLQDIKPAIILTDIEMPRMDGFEFAKHVRENAETKLLPLVMISSRTADKHKKFAKGLGVNAFLGKPVKDDALLKVVNSLIPTKS